MMMQKNKKLVDKNITTKDTNIPVGSAPKSIKFVVGSSVSSMQKNTRTIKHTNDHDPSKLSRDVNDSSKSRELSREEEEEEEKNKKSNPESSGGHNSESKIESILQPQQPDSMKLDPPLSVHDPLEKSSWNNSHDDHDISKPGPHISSDENLTKCSSVNSDKATRLTNHAAIWSDEMDFEAPSPQKSNSSYSLKLEPNDIWSEQDCRILEFLESNYNCNKWLYIQAAFFNWTGRMISGELIAHKFYSDGARQ